MYVRLKHALSALALEAVRSPGRGPASAAVTWLAAFCDAAASAVASAAGGGSGVSIAVPAAAVAAQVGPRSRGEARGLQRLLDAGLVEQRNALLLLPAGFEPYFPYMNRQVHRLAEVLRRLAATRPLGGPTGVVWRGIALFNGGLFFECHEYFEGLWRTAPRGEQALYRGIILVAAAFYHYEKGNRHGARVKLASGIGHLRPYLPAARRIRLDLWLARLTPWLARIEAGEPLEVLSTSQVPKIVLIR